MPDPTAPAFSTSSGAPSFHVEESGIAFFVQCDERLAAALESGSIEGSDKR
jgi:hypothetical protein